MAYGLKASSCDLLSELYVKLCLSSVRTMCNHVHRFLVYIFTGTRFGIEMNNHKLMSFEM